MGRLSWIGIAALLVAAGGCKKSSKDSGGQKANTGDPTGSASDKPPAPPEPQATWYRAVLTDDKGFSVPFRLEVPSPGSPGSAAAHGPDGRLEFRTSWKGDELHLDFDVFDTGVVAKRGADGSLTGTWEKRSPPWVAAKVKFTATPLPSPEAPLLEAEGAPIADADLEGVWHLELAESKDARLTLEATGGAVTGELEFPTGNLVSLKGIARGDKLRLTAFDGAPFLLDGTVKDGAFEGRFIAGAGLAWNETVTGKRGDFELEHKVSLQDDPTLSYKQVGAETYKGKPLILEVAGSWCSTCKRAAPFLVELYKKHHGSGLEMLTLTYEFTEDSAYNKKQAAKFKKEYNVPWEVRAVDGDLDDYWKILPDAIAEINPAGFPVALFVTASGDVIDIHAGFPTKDSPLYAKTTASYEALVAKLLESAKAK